MDVPGGDVADAALPLVSVHSLLRADLGWLLLVSAWAKRLPFLWAFLPLAAIGIIERIVSIPHISAPCSGLGSAAA